MSGFEAKIRQVKNDHSHGSSRLLQEIIEIYLTAKYNTTELMWSFSALGEIDSSMVVIHHFLSQLRPAIGHDFQHKVEQYLHSWKNANEAIAANLKAHLPSYSLTILTHSHSGVVIEVIKNLFKSGYSLKVMQTESLPGGEGIGQAKVLQQLGLEVSIAKDDRIVNIIKQVSCCFLGVDQYDEKSFINKVGSNNIVALAGQFNIPVFVLGDIRKKVKRTQLGPSNLFESVSLASNVKLLTS